jgi:type VI secretion system protein ImpG
MSDALLPYFERELHAVRRLAADYARAHEKIAGRLRLTDGVTDDPHVARLLDGVAFLAARVHHRLDDQFPELTDALLGVLYPHYLAPMPSATILQFTGKPDAKVPARIGRGFGVRTEEVRGERCDYTTTAEAVVWPVEIDSVRLSGLPLAAPPNPRAAAARGVLRIALRCATAEARFAELGVGSLRFFLRGDSRTALALYELLCAHTLSVAFADSPADPAPVIADAAAIAPVGFGPEDALLPWPARSFSGFRLLSEYFGFPEKFRFIDIGGIEAKTMLGAGNRMEIFVYLDRALPELERAVKNDALALGCAPAVNLFRHECDPVPLDQTTTEYRIEPAERRPGALEVWGVERVREATGDGRFRAWAPFHRLAEGGGEGEAAVAGFYHLLRRASSTLPGTDVFLAPFDPAFDPAAPASSVLSITALCLNRDLPAELPRGGGQPRMSPKEGMASITRVACLTAPTPTLRPPLRAAGFWPLVSQLSLGHLSVVGGAAGAHALREVLRLYDLRESDESRAAIAALVGVSAKPGTARLPPPPGVARLPPAQAGAFCRGLDVTLQWDARGWTDGGLYLLAAVLERFLALHTTVNSFVRVACMLRGQTDRVAAWPPRAGARHLL